MTTTHQTIDIDDDMTIFVHEAEIYVEQYDTIDGEEICLEHRREFVNAIEAQQVAEALADAFRRLDRRTFDILLHAAVSKPLEY